MRFQVPGLGISSLERVLVPLGYERVADTPPLAFPAKKLAATWFRAADPEARRRLPRVFVSEIQVRAPGLGRVGAPVCVCFVEKAQRSET